jgi:NitT/TauT family transport system permease protein
MPSSAPHKQPWFAVRKELNPRRRAVLGTMAFVLPLVVWGILSYTPVWKPKILITDTGDVSWFNAEQRMLVDRPVFARENAKMLAEGKRPAAGVRVNPDYFPAPHQVGKAFYTGFKTPPQRRGDPWLHESLLHSIRIIFWGFVYSVLVGLPLGILCGAFSIFSRLFEPAVDFVRYMPAPAFGALAVAILGIADAPKVAIIFIGTFFQMVLVVANTTRQFDTSLLEAAQTLGASRPRLVTHVVIPGILPNIYTDMRILLGWAWTYLIVAELVGTKSGITAFIDQQARYRAFDNVYAAIMMIGMIGLCTDVVLAWLGRSLFPWQGQRGRLMSWIARKGSDARRFAIESRYGTPAAARPRAAVAAKADP